jgi:hypothetical protein
MDGDQQALEQKFESLLRELSAVGEQLERCRRDSDKVPHYSEIERPAHEMGRRLSRAIQQEAMLRTAGRAGSSGKCAGCGRICKLELKTRSVNSVDGPTEVCEPVGYCEDCERSFFPSA